MKKRRKEAAPMILTKWLSFVLRLVILFFKSLHSHYYVFTVTYNQRMFVRRWTIDNLKYLVQLQIWYKLNIYSYTNFGNLQIWKQFKFENIRNCRIKYMKFRYFNQPLQDGGSNTKGSSPRTDIESILQKHNLCLAEIFVSNANLN